MLRCSLDRMIHGLREPHTGNKAGNLVDGGRRVIDDVDDAPIHYPRQSKFYRTRDVSLVNETESLG